MPVFPCRWCKQFFSQREQQRTSRITCTSNKKQTRRGKGGIKKYKKISLKIVGNNCAGLKGKKDSFENLLKTFSPAIVMLQETKLYKTY